MRANAPDLLFFDTEFSSLGEISPVEIISAALCDLQGRDVFYAELDDFDLSLCSDFTRQQVTPLLWREKYRMQPSALAAGFRDAVEALERPCILACDSSWDWMWACALAQGKTHASIAIPNDPRILPSWPKNLLPRRLHLDFQSLPEGPRRAAKKARAEAFSRSMPHHALTDVRVHASAVRAACEAAGLDFSNSSSTFALFGADPAAFQCPLPPR